MFFNRYLFVNETVCNKKLREMNIFFFNKHKF